MKRRGLAWQIVPAFVGVVAATVAITVWYSGRSTRSLLEQTTQVGLESTAKLVAETLRETPAADDPQRLAAVVQTIAHCVPYRITIVRADGSVSIDSAEDAARLENHANRPEILEARAHGLGRRLGYSRTLKREMLYVAVPVRADDPNTAVCRAAAALSSLESIRRASSRRVALAGGLSVLLGAAVSFWLSRRIGAPIAAMQAAADRLAKGELGIRLQGPNSRELASLAASLNAMAGELAGRIETVTRQKEEAEAILASMAEGVIALGPEALVLHLNQAAADILGRERSHLIGSNLRQVVRNVALYDILDRAFTSSAPVEGDVVLSSRGVESHLQVRGSRLSSPGAAGQAGAVLVLNDVTRLKRLENLRREFAANVSHELRTPITSIKGFVETLLDGALDDRADAERFLQIIRQQTDRLNSLIVDLLALAGIERDSEGGTITLTRLALARPLADAVAGRAALAAARRISVEVDCAADLVANLNPGLFQQAIINLLDNAIAYSEPGTQVRVTASQNDREVRIAVADQGRGIAREHLERVFERFYRVDKARNREAGGTGLGLAIVKHVVQAHKGRIDVASALGEGSTFTIALPRP